MPPGPTAPRAPPRPAACWVRARQPAPGSTPPATCGCSAGRAMAQPTTATSTICGDLYGRSDNNKLAAQRAVKSVRRNAMCPRASRALITLVAAMQSICLVGVALTLAGCGGSSSTSTPTPVTTITAITNYTVGGTITGLTVSSVVLANGTATVSVAAGASTWVFPNSFTPGSSYSVTVQTQPTGEQCEVTAGGSGKDTGNVGNVTVVCGFGQWSWEGGLNTVNANAVYGTQGTASASNVPGARYAASSWADSSGNFWLFGGVGYASTGGADDLNDLWRYSPSSKEWTWVSGGDGDNASGVYGTQGTASASNVP